MTQILFVGDPQRLDHYSYLNNDSGVEYSLLWYDESSLSKIDIELFPFKFKNNFFWRDYRSPRFLVKSIHPDKIVFLEIIDLQQVALIVAANALGISTFYLEHGAAGDPATSIERWQEIKLFRDKIPYLIKRLFKSLPSIVKTKSFYYSQKVCFYSIGNKIKYLLLPLKMLIKGPNETLAKNIFPERVPKYCICFNKEKFESLQVYTGVTESQAILTGVPFFDEYYSTETIEKDYIVFIEHPNLEQNVLDWNNEFHKRVANVLYDFARKNGKKIFVKLHPKSDIKNWLQYNFDSKFVEVIQLGNYTNLYLEAKLILGYSSSLMNGFICARKNIVLVGWHPKPRVFGSDFSKSGLCHLSLDISDLENKYEYWIRNNLALDDEKYIEYLKIYNYPFDGKATKRVLEAIRNL